MSSPVDKGRLRLFVVLRILEESVLTEDGLSDLLTQSLQTAKKIAQKGLTDSDGKRKLPPLKPEIYKYFEIAYHSSLGNVGWPETVNQYKLYVQLYMTKIPMGGLPEKYDHLEKEVMNIAKEYCSRAVQPLKDMYDVFQQSCYYEICHFYWLINQKLEVSKNHPKLSKLDGKLTLQSFPVFASWVKMFGLGQGVFLNTPESMTDVSKQTFLDNKMYNPEWYNENKDDWISFNQFFCRQFNKAGPNGFSPYRPIDRHIYHITSPADCTYKACYNISDKGEVMDINGNPVIYKLKGFSPGSSVEHLLGANCRPFWKDFYGGTFIHYFLSPYDYHRFHTPVSGVVMALETINGQNYVDIVLTKDGDFDAPDNAEDGYEFRQERGCIILDNAVLGKVACLPIGMGQVSGVHMYQDQLLYRKVAKGREFGYFLFGGSDIILLISKPADQLYIVKEDYGGVPNYFKYGEMAVNCNP